MAPDESSRSKWPRARNVPARAVSFPAAKTAEIAAIRHTTTGTTLDFAAAPPRYLQHRGSGPTDFGDLKQVNPAAVVSVKLVAEAGVGTACRVVKWAAARTWSTLPGMPKRAPARRPEQIKCVGSPWEVGWPKCSKQNPGSEQSGALPVRLHRGGLQTAAMLLPLFWARMNSALARRPW